MPVKFHGIPLPFRLAGEALRRMCACVQNERAVSGIIALTKETDMNRDRLEGKWKVRDDVGAAIA